MPDTRLISQRDVGRWKAATLGEARFMTMTPLYLFAAAHYLCRNAQDKVACRLPEAGRAAQHL
jgi:hypothetical protein